MGRLARRERTDRHGAHQEMRRFDNHTIALLAARLLLGIVFIVASIDKISSPDAFAASIHAYRLTPAVIENLLAIIIPWIELLCGCSLVMGVNVRAGSLLLTLLLGVFTIAISIALVRGLKIDCGCFGKEHLTPVSWGKVLEDLGLMIVGVYLLIAPAGNSFGPQADFEETA
jgi:uncharacterized membrane protein YphA (DoxX/SURF4 family)